MTYDGWWRQLDCVGGGGGGGGGGGAVREPDGGLPAHLGQLRVLVRGSALLQPRTLRWLDCLDIDSLLKMESWWQSNDKVSYIIKSSPSCSLLINQKLLRIKRWKIFLPTNKIISKSHSPFTKVLWTYFLSLKNWQITINGLLYLYITFGQGWCPTLRPSWPWCPRIWGNRHSTSCWRYSPPSTFCE